MNNPEENFEIDYETYEIEKGIYYAPKSSLNNIYKKSVGVFTKDIKINLIKTHPLFKNDNFNKHILIPQNNLDKMQEEATQINEFNKM